MSTSDPRSDSRSAQWLRSNLATIGSAAVFAVYAAGWARTKKAADLLEEQSQRTPLRRRSVALQSTGQIDETPRPRTEAPGQPAQPTVDGTSSVAQTTAPAEQLKGPGEAKPETKPVADAKMAQAPTAARSTTVAPTPAPNIASGTTPAPQLTVAPAAPSAVPAAPATTAAPVAMDVPMSSDTRPPDRQLATTNIATVPASAGAGVAADPDAPVVYKDGVFSGWGSSRHGDIEAYVEIKEGRIKSAFISECLTQYSCDWIVRLPPEVVKFQSSDIDYISGATQSSNAFYYAVVAALKKAAVK